MNKNYRIHTNVSQDTILHVNMEQDFDFLEVLSLKLRQTDAYKLHSSNYGVIVGRVLANDAFGIPNAKISVFIEHDDSDSTEISSIYPYAEVMSKDNDGRRYNLLPDYSDDKCYKAVGTFPNKRLVLDNNTQLEIYDRYWKYTTVTNQAGDYMLFGVPTGSTQLHVDIDLSDIGVLSQKPRDFEYKGYNLTMFDSPVQFKDSTNLDSLAQIFAQNQSVFVYPFWGDEDNGIAAITRSDIQIQYKFEPTCVFLGSIVSDNGGNAIGHKCALDVNNGMNNQLVGGNGTIEMIRKTTDGLVEEYQIQGNQLIDENGVWCYQIPMNLDYIGTDEYGNIVPTDNPNKGIPTRTQVRFRISKTESSDEGFSRHTAKYLVPMNPIFSEDEVQPTIPIDGSEVEKMYNFGSATPDSCFRDLYWNNVYSVKNYIPKVQVAHRAYSKNYGALKGANLVDDQNPIPFNKLRVDLPFVYMIVCILFTIVMMIISFINSYIICTINDVLGIFHFIKDIKIPLINVRIFYRIPVPGYLGCISLSAGLSEGNIAYYPGCRCSDGLKAAKCPDDMEGDCVRYTDNDELLDVVQRNLALEYNIVKLDLYQDWINGCLYMPLWYWRKRKKKTFLFFTISKAKNEYCSCDSLYSRLKTYVTCNLTYKNNSFGTDNSLMPDKESKWHKNVRGQVRFRRGLIKPVENNDGLTVYYYAALQATENNANPDLEMAKRNKDFLAIRLYATDIILLGNLDEKNIYGIPQFFKCLPSSTANVPPIATIEEEVDASAEEENNSKDISSAEDSGNTITTGMDWNHDGGSMSPKYKSGLFMDLACTYANTKPKSCINVERLSELGVTLDMTNKVAYSNGSTIKYGDIDSDGFVSKYELEDNENRAMFATLNHIGFIPQSYQDLTDSYTTQVADKSTNYLVPKFKYIYPVDFDGRLATPMSLYKNGFAQALYDEADESYITFRLGAENNKDADKNNEHRIRHFYHVDGNRYDMPLYNNSYYFYFGIRKGNTAIDKFNKMFTAECYQRSKAPFTLDYSIQSRSYCPQAYSYTPIPLDGVYPTEDKINKAYGYIRVDLDDIKSPYQYTLYDNNKSVVISESGMTASVFVIGGIYNEDKEIQLNCNGVVRYQMNDKEIVDNKYGESGLTNQIYTLEVIDSEGNTQTVKVQLDGTHISGYYEGKALSAKFYNTTDTRIDYICNDNNQFYGVIKIKGFSIDGYECKLTGIEIVPNSNPNESDNDTYKFNLSGSSTDITSTGIVTAQLELKVLDDSDTKQVKDCLCDAKNDISIKQQATMSISGTSSNPCYLRFNQGNSGDSSSAEIFIYQPNRYYLAITQICNGQLLEDNSSSDIITINNGGNFLTFLNGMPTRFMLGTDNDNSNAEVSNNSNFYYSTAVKDINDKHISGWFGLQNETSYKFAKVTEENSEVWKEVTSNLSDDILTATSQRTIIRYKLNNMFSLAEGAYITTDSTCQFTFTAQGGVSPILYRSVAPIYDDPNSFQEWYYMTDNWETTCLQSYPNIVGNNYNQIPNHTDANDTKPKFNELYKRGTQYVGNYFAAFTRDGGYVSKNKIDSKINIMRSPSFASITPTNINTVKTKGQDIKGHIEDNFSRTHTKSDSQQLDGDIKRTTLPYLRALYVDRRFDYDLTIFGPVVTNNFSLYANSDDGRNRIWQSGRMSGFTYNGIEMSYDDNYNVISATTQLSADKSETISASRNNLLEYSYEYVSGSNTSDAVTIYNDSNDCQWIGDNNNKQIVKRFYLSEIANMDIRNYYWSTFNKTRLYQYAQTHNIEDSYPYVYKYPNNQEGYYNGSFGHDNYPTKRYIDIGNLPITSSYYYDNQSCSYAMTAYTETQTIDEQNDENGESPTHEVIVAETTNGDESEITLTFGSPITIVAQVDKSQEDANIIYHKSGTDGGYAKFVAQEAMLTFNYTTNSCEGFNVYTKVPRLIQVLPYINNEIDGIGYLKTVNSFNEFGKYGDGESIDSAIEKITLKDGLFSKDKVGLEDILTGNPIPEVTCPEGVSVGEGYKQKNGKNVSGKFFKKDNEWLDSSDDAFASILFSKKIKNLDTNSGSKANVFAVLVEREYQYDDDDNLTKHLKTLETSELFDCRDTLIKVNNDDGMTYAMMTQTDSSTEIIESEDESGNTEVTTEEKPIKIYQQVVTFDMLFKYNSDIGERQCEALTDYQLLSYTFRFTNNNGDSFDVQPSKIQILQESENSDAILRLTVNWLANMDIAASADWVGNNTNSPNHFQCSLLIRTNSGFTYKLSTFYLRLDKSVFGPYSKPQDFKDSMVDGQQYPTRITIE